MTFEIYPDVWLVVVAHLHGMPVKIAEIKEVCGKYEVLMLEHMRIL